MEFVIITLIEDLSNIKLMLPQVLLQSERMLFFKQINILIPGNRIKGQAITK